MKSLLQNTLLLVLLFLFTTCSLNKGLIPFIDGNKYGLKTQNGQIRVLPQYRYINDEDEKGLFIVYEENKCGLMNKKGEFLTEMKFDHISDFTNDRIASTRINELCGFIDDSGVEIVPCIYEETLWFKEGIAQVQQNGKWGFINNKNEVVIPIIYERLKYSWSEGLIGAKLNDKWGFIDKDNNVVIPFIYSEVDDFSEGLALVGETYRNRGYIDHLNNIVIPFIYGSSSSEFKNGIAQVSLNRKMGCINKKGECVVPFKYNSVHPFYKGFAYILIDNGKVGYKKNKILYYGYIDSIGNEYLMPYTKRKNINWNIKPVPVEIPDYSDLLTYYWTSDYESNNGYEFISFTEDEYGNEYYDTCYNVNFEESFNSNHPSCVSKLDGKKWTLEGLLNLSLNEFVQTPRIYPDLNRITKALIGYGLLGSGRFSGSLAKAKQQGEKIFRKETIFRIISTETLRMVTWEWISPYYKQAFQTMHPFHQQCYKDIALHLKDYMNNYDIKKVKAHLKKDERKFAKYDFDGKYNPNRKLCAFVDRLILIHKVITVEEAKIWVSIIADEVLTW